MEPPRRVRRDAPATVLNLEAAVAAWIRAHYYLRRPWAHPRRAADPALAHMPVTEDLIQAEDGLLRAFLGAPASGVRLEVLSAKKAGAAVWQEDLRAIGEAKQPAKAPVPVRKPRNLFGGR